MQKEKKMETVEYFFEWEISDMENGPEDGDGSPGTHPLVVDLRTTAEAICDKHESDILEDPCAEIDFWIRKVEDTEWSRVTVYIEVVPTFRVGRITKKRWG